MIRALILAAHLIEPDCQRLCLGVCTYDWQHGYCADTMVARLGEWDVVPWGYVPPKEHDFVGWVVPYPKSYGEYPMEQVSSVHETDLGWVP
jgi:hypothetical protein